MPKHQSPAVRYVSYPEHGLMADAPVGHPHILAGLSEGTDMKDLRFADGHWRGHAAAQDRPQPWRLLAQFLGFEGVSIFELDITRDGPDCYQPLHMERRGEMVMLLQFAYLHLKEITMASTFLATIQPCGKWVMDRANDREVVGRNSNTKKDVGKSFAQSCWFNRYWPGTNLKELDLRISGRDCLARTFQGYDGRTLWSKQIVDPTACGCLSRICTWEAFIH